MLIYTLYSITFERKLVLDSRGHRTEYLKNKYQTINTNLLSIRNLWDYFKYTQCIKY